jgi:type I site-specific restriction endonuclease
MNEAETRAELIDPLLTAAGWGVVEGSRIRREFSITPGRIEGGGRRGKPLTADSMLTYRNTQLAVVEAKPDGVYAIDMASGEGSGSMLSNRNGPASASKRSNVAAIRSP